MIVTLKIHLSNGQRVTDQVMVPSHNETAAVCEALDVAVLAYPNAKSIMWDSVTESGFCEDVEWLELEIQE